MHYTPLQGPYTSISVTFNDEFAAKKSPYSVLVTASFGSTYATSSSANGIRWSLATAGTLSVFAISSKNAFGAQAVVGGDDYQI